MKMQNILRATSDCKVKKLFHQVGDSVAVDQTLVGKKKIFFHFLEIHLFNFFFHF